MFRPSCHIVVTWFRNNVSDGDVATLSVDHLNLRLRRALDRNTDVSGAGFARVHVEFVYTDNNNGFEHLKQNCRRSGH